MKRMRKAGCSAGLWMSEDSRFYICRPLTSSGKRGSVWRVGSVQPECLFWLEEQGLKERRFPTRREALARLNDALQLEDFPD